MITLTYGEFEQSLQKMLDIGWVFSYNETDQIAIAKHEKQDLTIKSHNKVPINIGVMECVMFWRQTKINEKIVRVTKITTISEKKITLN